MNRPRTTEIPGYRVQPMLPVALGLLGAECIEAHLTEYDGAACVEALVRVGLIPGPYTFVLSINQALEADIIERA